MNVLALDCALGPFTVAIGRDGVVRAQRSDSGKRALEHGLQLVTDALQQAGVLRGEIDRIAVGAGPGSFTGIRIALSYAKALALAWRAQLVTLSSYDILERGRTADPALAVVAGRPGIVCARLRAGKATRTACGAPADVLGELGAGALRSVTLFGDAEDVREALAERGIEVIVVPPPPSAAVALLALARHATPLAHPHAARPEYGERPAATPPPGMRA